jgi:hypothetical protein
MSSSFEKNITSRSSRVFLRLQKCIEGYRTLFFLRGPQIFRLTGSPQSFALWGSRYDLFNELFNFGTSSLFAHIFQVLAHDS